MRAGLRRLAVTACCPRCLSGPPPALASTLPPVFRGGTIAAAVPVLTMGRRVSPSGGKGGGGVIVERES